ncbi:UDP-N-acetylenolpyruvoylglucosamine reductase, partial [bacterium J17]
FLFLGDETVSPLRAEEFLNNAQSIMPQPVELGRSYRVLVFAAAALMSLSRKFSGQGLSGLEFAAGIPASLGGAIAMNAGAHGSQISDVLDSVLVYLPKQGLEHLRAEDLNFSYRHSSLSEGALVLAAQISLEAKSKEEVSTKRAECLGYRKQTQPLSQPSSGSVFKNPTPVEIDSEKRAQMSKNVTAAELLDAVGVKGLEMGGVAFSNLHANWLVRVSESASSNDVLVLVKEAQKRVWEKYGISLEPEIVFW